MVVFFGIIEQVSHLKRHESKNGRNKRRRGARKKERERKERKEMILEQ